MRLGLSTTLVWDSGFHMGDCKWTKSSMWETPSKSRRLNHPPVTAGLVFRNFLQPLMLELCFQSSLPDTAMHLG